MAKLGTELAADYQQYQQSLPTPLTGAVAASTDPLLQFSNGDVELETYANSGAAPSLLAGLKELNSTHITRHGREIDAAVPFNSLPRLASMTSLRFARPSSAVTSAGAVTSQGDIAIATAAARSTYGVTGSGVEVGIVSDSFNNDPALTDHYANDITSKDLPANVSVLAEDPSAGTDEGRAIAQVIYDEAPGVSLAFATGEGSQSTMAANIGSLVTAGAKAIVDDISSLYEPFFEDGVIAQAVTSAVSKGVTYFSAAGNNGSDAYASSWKAGVTRASGAIASASGAPAFYGGTSLNFGSPGAVNDMNSFTLGAGQSIKLSLQWDSPYYSVSKGAGDQNQVDGYILNADGSQIVGGGVNLDIGGDPIQVFQYTNTGSTAATYNLMIDSESGAAPGYFKYIDFDGQATNWTYAPNSGTIFGHANATGAEAVGAAYYGNTPAFGATPPQLEATSSTGGTPILFNTSGVRLTTPITRQEPGLVAADGVATTFFGSEAGQNAYPSFYGTSAAAAGAAGAAALLLQIKPSLTPALVDSVLQSTATAIGSSPNFQSGYGLIQANTAIASIVGNISGTVFQDNNGNGTLDNGETGASGVRVYLDAGNTGSYIAGDIFTTTASDGTYTLANVPTGSAVVRETTPGGFIAITASRTVTVAVGTISGTNFGIFPDAFIGNAGGYSYTVQADAKTNTNLDIYVGSVLTYTVARSLLPALTFTLGGINNSLTVNFANGTPSPTGGITFTPTGAATGNTFTINGTTGSDSANINNLNTTYNNSIIFLSNVQNEIINGNGGNDAFSVINAQPAGQNVTFNGGTGNASLLIKSPLPNNGVGTIFNAGITSTDQNSLTVSAGTWTFAGDPAATSANLTVNDNSSVIFAAGTSGSGINPRHLAALNLGATATLTLAAPPTHTDREVLVTGTLAITAGGKLNMDGNDMVVSNGSITSITNWLTTGFNNGLWNGAGIQSSAAATDTTYLTAIGSMLNNSITGPIYGTGTVAGLFDGISPASTAVVLKYTYYGDANLSGFVDGSDYPLVDNGFNNSLTGWQNGDFNYDGFVNGSDYTLVDNAFNTEPTPL